jgi:hypothetical protein
MSAAVSQAFIEEKYQSYLFVRSSGQDSDRRRASKRVNLFQLRSCATFLVALEGLDIIFNVQLLEQPDEALSARLLEPGIPSVCVEELYA